MYKALVLAAVASVVAAQGSAIPTCAQSCVSLPAQCNLDPKCICTDTVWISDISCCISKSCDEADQKAALAYAQTICTPVGATLPAEASCSDSTSSASSSASATSSGSSSTSNAVSSASASASAATSSAASAASSAASAASSAATSAAGAAQGALPAVGGVIGAIIGAAALL